jgi:hypothetical protein
MCNNNTTLLSRKTYTPGSSCSCITTYASVAVSAHTEPEFDCTASLSLRHRQSCAKSGVRRIGLLLYRWCRAFRQKCQNVWRKLARFTCRAERRPRDDRHFTVSRAMLPLSICICKIPKLCTSIEKYFLTQQVHISTEQELHISTYIQSTFST